MNSNEKKNNEAKRTANAKARTEKLNGENFVNKVIAEITETTATVEEVAEVETVETTATVEAVAEVNTTTETATAVETVAEVETVETVATAEEVAEVKTPLSLDEIRDKGKTIYVLSEKYDEVKAKAEHLKSFKLTHQKENAKIVLSDADGKTFSSSNPKAVSKFIEYCEEQFVTALAELETEIRKIS